MTAGEANLRTGARVALVLFAIPALYQMLLVAIAIFGRVTYPYDLEWMEGGMLHHALRLHQGHALYAAPSVDFIPYLYTPLYPALLATLGKLFGISYGLARAISVLALLGIGVTAGIALAGRRDPLAWCGAVLALGLFAAAYPFVEGWYDIARGDTLFLAMVTAGIAALPYLARTGDGWRGHARVAAGAAILALAYFCKQTGFFYVAFGGVIVTVVAWRRLPAYIASAGVIGLGGTAVMNAASHGWFWIYISKIHREHDFSMQRFWESFGNILWHFPAVTIVVAIALAGVIAAWLKTRTLPADSRRFLLWTGAFAMSIVVGAIGWGTQFAHFNAYMPALLHGAFAAGAALPALYASARLLWSERIGQACAIAGALALALTCAITRWSPSTFTPSEADAAAGAKLVEHIRSLAGDIWVPSHPWYAELAGKTAHAHRMGIKDVTTQRTQVIVGLDRALAQHAFGAIVMDNRDLFLELPQLRATYHLAMHLPADERPRVYTGARITPESIWLPLVPPVPPAGATRVFDFEARTWAGWTKSGDAWGAGPVDEALPDQDLVTGSTGLRFATSFHGGERSMGRTTSPAFAITGPRITMMLGGTTDAAKLRVELWVNGQLARTASVPEPGGEGLKLVTWNVADLVGENATLALVDESPAGHLDVDDVWIWDTP